MILDLDRDVDHDLDHDLSDVCTAVSVFFFKGWMVTEQATGRLLSSTWMDSPGPAVEASPTKGHFFFIFVSILFKGFLFLLVDVLCFASVADWLGIRRVDLHIYLLGATFGRRRTVFVGQGRR